jgi:hypothetical protein
MIPGGTSEDTILFAKNTSGGKPEGTTHSLDELPFDLTILLGLQNGIADPLSRLCN